jgi:cobalamin biosynthetic protein CobC
VADNRLDSSTATRSFHGGDISAAEAEFGSPAAGWLDLSTGINAEAYPETGVSPEAWRTLPQSGALKALIDASRRYYRVPDRLALVAAGGSQALLPCLPGIVAGGRVAIVGPTYAEHGRVWHEHGYEIRNVTEFAGASAGDIAVVVNPNNPDGRIVPLPELLHFASAISAWRGLLIVDEAFADVAPDASLLPHLSNDHRVIVLRSFGKFFGLAGLRLGFAAGPPALIDRLARRLGPWAVSGPAIEVGTRALNDTAWISAARTRLVQRRKALDDTLSAGGLRIVGGTDLFRLVDDPAAPALYRRLGKAGIFVRAFEDRPTVLRFGVPGSKEALDRLAAALAGPADSQ